jgi:hypothetical protein
MLVAAFCAAWGFTYAAKLPELGSLSGKVTAAKPFQGAQVYIRNVDKHVLYMVYTAEGRYQAVNLLPGSYEVSVKKNGFMGDVKKLEVKSGASLTADFSLLSRRCSTDRRARACKRNQSPTTNYIRRGRGKRCSSAPVFPATVRTLCRRTGAGGQNSRPMRRLI